MGFLTSTPVTSGIFGPFPSREHRFILMPDSPLSILLVEDSPVQAMLMQKCLQQIGVPILGPVSSAEEALRLCAHQLPALAILDVELAGAMDGLALAQELMLLGQVALVFTSSTESAATMNRIWQLQPLAFLPKPYNLNALRRIVELGLYGRMKTPVEWGLEPPQEDVITQMPWLFVRERNLLIRVLIADILCVEMDQKYCLLRSVAGRCHSVRTSLAQLLRHLAPAGFVQVHRSWLVQLSHVEAVDSAAGIIRLPAKVEVPLGRAYRDDLLGRLQLLD